MERPQLQNVVNNTTNHGATFQKTKRVKAKRARAKSDEDRIPLVQTGL